MRSNAVLTVRVGVRRSKVKVQVKCRRRERTNSRERKVVVEIWKTEKRRERKNVNAILELTLSHFYCLAHVVLKCWSRVGRDEGEVKQ